MYSQTIAALEKFDNAHDFERMCADLLIAQGIEDVVLIAPRGGPDGGMDITFTTGRGGKGLACVTLREDIDTKFQEDFSQRRPGEFNKYMLFCTAYLSTPQKLKYAQYCLITLQAEFVPQDIEVLRSLLDVPFQGIRETYLHIKDQTPHVNEAKADRLRPEFARVLNEVYTLRDLATRRGVGVTPEVAERSAEQIGKKFLAIKESLQKSDAALRVEGVFISRLLEDIQWNAHTFVSGVQENYRDNLRDLISSGPLYSLEDLEGYQAKISNIVEQLEKLFADELAKLSPASPH